MKVIVVDPFSTSPNYSNTIANYLSKSVNKVYLIGANKSLNSMSEQENSVIRIPFISKKLDRPLDKKYYFLQNFLRFFLYAFSLLKIYLLVLKKDINVVHFQWSHIPLLELCLIFLLKKRCKIIYTFHNSTAFHGEKHFIKELLSAGKKVLLKNVDKFIVHTNYSKKIFAKDYPNLINKCRVIPRGKDFFLNSEEKKTLNKKINNTFIKKEIIDILFFGQISHYKGVDILIKSIPYLKRTNFRIHIYGRSEMNLDSLFNLIKKHKAENKVFWKIKFLNNEEVDKAFQMADILAFPYRHIDQSAVLMSALDYGKPIVASKVGGFEEILSHEINGLLFETENSRDLAKCLDKLINDKEKRDIYGEENLKLSKSWPSWDKISEYTLKVYNEI